MKDWRTFFSFLSGLPVGRVHTTIVVLCLAFGLLAAFAIWNEEKEDAESEFQEEAQNRFAVITTELDSQLHLLESAAAFDNGNGEPDWSQFRTFARKLLIQNQAIEQLAWIARVPADQRAAWQQAARKRGFACPDGKSTQADYFPVLFCEPANHLPVGHDLGALLSPLQRPGASVGGKNLAMALNFDTSQDGVSRCALVYPLLHPPRGSTSTNTASNDLKGYLLCELDLKHLFDPLFNRFRPIGMDVEVRDLSTHSDGAVLFRYLARVPRPDITAVPSETKNQPRLTLEHQFGFAGKLWSVRCHSVPGYFKVQPTLLFWIVLGSAIGITVLVNAFLAGIGHQRQRVQHLVEERTTQLVQVNSGLEQEVRRRTEIEQALEASLAAKEVLLREVHHRVNNNLQVICSLLQLHADHLSDVVAQASLREMRDRVRSMALVYERLQATDDRTQIDFTKYIQKLATELNASHGGKQNKVSIQFNLEDISLDLDTAIPCGLILTELLTNAFKYAFPTEGKTQSSDDSERVISVWFHKSPTNQNVLIVRDNGIGLPSNIDLDSKRTLGLQLVNLMVEQLEGRIVLNRENGTSYMLTFPAFPILTEVVA